jgi:histidyl-tRNA synthetase
MRDFLPGEKARREAVMAAIRASFAGFGYREIETPVAEDLGRLESGDSGDNQKLIFKILRRGLTAGERVDPATVADLGLRFDLTVPLSRFYATHRGELPEVFRSIQIAPVWRAERPQKGRYRQFTQCDIDVIGEPSPLAEVELLTAASLTIDGLGITGSWIRINDRKLLAALLASCGFAPEAQGPVLVTVDKLDKIGMAGVAAELAAGGAGPAGERLVEALEAVASVGGGEDVDKVLEQLPPAAAEAGADLRTITAGVAAAAPEVRLVADPTLVRGQGYYTGPIFEVMHPAFTGSISGGGRYDGMIGRFAGRDVPACGISIGFERVVDLVDVSRFAETRERLAVIYDPATTSGVVVGWQRRLLADGADVRLVRRIRNQGRMLDELAADGCSAYLDLTADAAGPVPGAPTPPLRPIRSAQS